MVFVKSARNLTEIPYNSVFDTLNRAFEIDTAKEKLNELNSHKSQSVEAGAMKIEMAGVNRKANDQLQEILSNQQRYEWSKLLGSDFDLKKLGDVCYKAPEFATKTERLHSRPLQLSSLRGKVVVIH